jgi:hypothetical protein
VPRRWSFNDTDSSSLSFHCPEDALNRAGQIAKAAKNWATAKDWNFAKRYAEGHINIVLAGRFASNPRDYDLVLSPVPSRAGSAQQRVEAGITHKFDILDVNSRVNDGYVLGCIRKLIECPQGWVPSLVRLELHKQRLDFVRDVLGLGFEVPLKLSLSVTKGKVCLSSRVSRGDSASAMIQGRSEIFDSRHRPLRDPTRHPMLELDFINVAKAIRVRLGEALVAVQGEIDSAKLFQLRNIMICPSDSFEGAGEFARDYRSAEACHD